MKASKVLQLIKGTSLAVSKRDEEKRDFSFFTLFCFDYLNAPERSYIVNKLERDGCKDIPKINATIKLE